MKKCKQCNLSKPETDFQRAVENKDSLSNTCKLCVNIKNKAKYYEKKNNKLLFY